MGHNSLDDADCRTQERSDLKSALKRVMIRTGLNARVKIGEMAQALADACAQPQFQAIRPYKRTEGSGDFADLPSYGGIAKHREIAKVFKIGDPFYRCHDGHMGT